MSDPVGTTVGGVGGSGSGSGTGMGTSGRAHPPAQSPPPFPEPVLRRARRIPGLIVQPPKTGERNSFTRWSDGCISADDAVTKPDLVRNESVSGTILVIESESNSGGGGNHRNDDAYMVHRKIRQSDGGSVRVGFGLCCPKETEGGYEVETDVGLYPYKMYAIKTQIKPDSILYKGTSKKETSSSTSKSVDEDSSDNSVVDTYGHETDQAALQWVANHDPEGKGLVLASHCMAADNHHLYTITPFHREGTLLEYVGEKGILKEPQARFFFKQILQGLHTLKQMEVCHRSLSLDAILLRGHTCTIGNLISAIRVPTNTDTGMVHLIEPQPPYIHQPPQCMAPELFRQEAFDGYAVDLWAASVMLFMMLLGMDYLFTAPIPEDPRFKEICIRRNLREFLICQRQRQEKEGGTTGGVESAEKADESTGGEESSTKPASTPLLSDNALSLLQSLLLVEARDRLTLSGVMEHPWVQSQEEELPSIQVGV